MIYLFFRHRLAILENEARAALLDDCILYEAMLPRSNVVQLPYLLMTLKNR
jgi:hypothetical protein